MMNRDDVNSARHDFDMSSFVEDHMSKEDLGPETSIQDWTYLQNLGRELARWEESIGHMTHTPQERNRWSQVPPRAPDKKDPQPRPWGRKGKGKEISCFHASTSVRMFTTTKGSPEYTRGWTNWSKETNSALDVTGGNGGNQAKATSTLWSAS